MLRLIKPSSLNVPPAGPVFFPRMGEPPPTGAGSVGGALAEAKDKIEALDLTKYKFAPPVPGRVVAPSKAARVLNFPSFLGGGSMVIDPTQPGKLIKMERELTPQESSLIRGGIVRRGAEIEHIRPLQFGGLSTALQNIQLLNPSVHEKKSKVENVAAELYYAGDISLNEARVLSGNWQNRNVDDVHPVRGRVDLDTARRKLREWKGAPQVGIGDLWQEIKSNLKKLPQAAEAFVGGTTAAITSAIADLFTPGDKYNSIQEGLKYAKKTMAGKEGFTSSPLGGEFLKGSIEGVSGGWIPAEQGEFISQTAKTTAAVSRATGNIAGTLLSFAGLTSLVNKAATKFGLGSLLKSTRIGQTISPAVKGITTTSIPVKANKIGRILSDIGIFGLHGQLSKQERNDFASRTERLFQDMAMGATLGTASLVKRFGPSTFLAGLGTYTISRIAGDEEKDALLNSGIVMGLHGLGRFSGAQKARAAELDKAATVEATNFFRQYGLKSPITGEGWTTANKQNISQLLGNVKDKITARVADGLLSLEERDDEIRRAVVAARQIYKGGLSREMRLTEEVKDLLSLFERNKKAPERPLPDTIYDFKDTFKSATNLPRVVGVDKEGKPIYESVNEARARITAAERGLMPVAVEDINSFRDAPQGRMQITGVAEQVDPQTANNIRFYKQQMDSGQPIVSNRVYLVLDDRPSMVAKIEDVNRAMLRERPEEIKSGTMKLYDHPANNVRVVGYVNGQEIDLGFFPRRFRIDHPETGLSTQAVQYGYDPFDSNLNKDTMADYMRAKDIKVLPVTIEKISEVSRASNQPYLIVNWTTKDWAEARAIGKRMAIQRGIRAEKEIAKVQIKEKGQTASKEINRTVPETPAKTVIVNAFQQMEQPLLRGDMGAFQETANNLFGRVITEDLATQLRKNPQNLTVGNFIVWLEQAKNTNRLSAAGETMYNLLGELIESSALKADNPLWKLGLVKIAQKPLLAPPRAILGPTEGISKESVVPAAVAKVAEKVEKYRTAAGVELKKETLPTGFYWLEQNVKKVGGKWTPVAQAGHNVEHLFTPQGNYAGKIRIDGKEYTYPEAEALFLNRTVPVSGTVKTATAEQETLPSPPEPAVIKERVIAEQSAGEAEGIQNLPELKETYWRDWDKYGGEAKGEARINKGADVLFTNKEIELERASKYEEAAKIRVAKQGLTRVNLAYKARQVLEQNKGDNNAAFEQFKKEFGEFFVKNGINDPFADRKSSQVLRHHFLRLSRSTPYRRFAIDGNKFTLRDDVSEPTSDFNEKINKFNQENNTDIDVVYFNNKESRLPRLSAPKKVEYVKNILNKNGYVFIGPSGPASETIYGVKFDRKLVDKYEINPDNYLIAGEEAPRNDFDKFIRVLFHDVLGAKKEFYDSQIPKRSKIFNSRVPQNTPGRTYRHYVLPSRTLGELGVIDKSRLSKDTSAEAIAGLDKTPAYDGVILMSKPLLDEVSRENGFPFKQYRHKPTVSYNYKDPQTGENRLILMKGNIISYDDSPWREMLEKQIGRRLGKYDVITFDENVKVGKEDIPFIGGKDGQVYQTIDIPSENYRFQYEETPEARGSLSFSILGGLGHNPEVSKALVEWYRPQAEKFLEFKTKFKAADSGEEIGRLLKEYYGIDLGEQMYERFARMQRLGAGKITLWKQLDDLVSQIFKERVINAGFAKGAHLKLAPDFGFKDETGNSRYVKPNEIMVGEKTWKELGEPQYVLSIRYPTAHTIAMTKDKVLVGERYGINNLNDEHIIPSFHDVRVNKSGDFDGDDYHIFPVGGKEGFPEKVANYIEQLRKERGESVLTVDLEKYGNRPPTQNNLVELGGNTIMGDDAVAISSAIARHMPAAVDSKLRIEVSASNGKNSRSWRVYFGRYLYKQGQIDADNKSYKSVTITPSWSVADETLNRAVRNEATDAVKSPALANRNWTDDYLIKQFYKTEDPAIIRIIQDIDNDLDSIFSVSLKGQTISDTKPIVRKLGLSKRNDLTNDQKTAAILDYYNQLSDKIEDGGGRLTPTQEIARLFKNTPAFTKPTAAINVSSDLAAVQAVEKTFGSGIKITPKAKDFIRVAEKATDDYARAVGGDVKKTIRQSVLNYYYKNLRSYNTDDIKTISYWAATSPNANIARPNRGQELLFIYRFDELFIPEHARLYFQVRESFGKGL